MDTNNKDDLPNTTNAIHSVLLPKNVHIHPLVLLSIVDHHKRQSKKNKRVLGILLGQSNKSSCNVANSFAVPFEDTSSNNNRDVFYLDHDYFEVLEAMFKKINAKEKLIGWYHTGKQLNSSDLEINEKFKEYTQNPVLLVVDVNNQESVPKAYYSTEHISQDGSSSGKTFVNVESLIVAEEAEEIGVEHMLREVQQSAKGNLEKSVSNISTSLAKLKQCLQYIGEYIGKVARKELPLNIEIIKEMQLVLMDLSTKTILDEKEFSKIINTTCNDNQMMTYVGSIVRSIIALHELIDNKLMNSEMEKNMEHENNNEAKTANTLA